MMTKPIKLLVVDDEPNMCRILQATLQREGYDVQSASNGREALKALKSFPAQVVITDLRMPVLDGMGLLREITVQHADIPVIFITAHGSIENAVEAIKAGAFDYISKPFDIEELRLVIAKAALTYQLNREECHDSGVVKNAGIVASSNQIKEVLRLVDRVAESPTTILITGESGTGKELVAQLIHKLSLRRTEPFIRINCAAVPETLLESEFFGYEKGAFTGAVTSKPGRFELADRGTLFLDEIGEISREMQVKLLRVLQEREFERVGGLKTIRVDVRLVVATNLDLEKAVQDGRFRQDLFYRLNVVRIHLPPLRDRPEDIPPLIEHFIGEFSRRLNRTITGISPEAVQLLCRYQWPGNIRELENVMERAVLLSSDTRLSLQDFDLVSQGTHDKSEIPSDEPALFKDYIAQETEKLEKRLLESALNEAGWNVTKASRMLGLSRKGLQLKMRKYGFHAGPPESRN